MPVFDFLFRYVGLLTSTMFIMYGREGNDALTGVVLAFICVIPTVISNLYYYNLGQKNEEL